MNERDRPRESSPADDSITLSTALKLSGMVDTGGQAKQRIQAGEVRVNGEVETRRKRKLCSGDVVQIDDEEFVIEQNGGDEPSTG